ncbi:MAG: phosphate acyltransferase PlsX [Rikenellaceae bacterium]
MLKIGLDAMGGDYAPLEIVLGAVAASKLIGKDSKIVLFGDSEQIKAILKEQNCSEDTFEIVHCSEVISMCDNPAQSFAKKTDSSITVGFKYLKENKIDGFASAGSTGAMMVGCMYSVKQINGVIRPAISSVIPAKDGGTVLVLDVGLNVDCKADVLDQYAILGQTYYQHVLGKEKPTVALLNIGEEKSKGNLAVKAAYEIMAENENINFIGNLESKYIFSGKADVVVCDAFVGNTMLKMAEGFYHVLDEQGVHNEFIDRMNYERVGGTPVLGINGAVIIGHGCSSALAVQNMILQTEVTIQSQVIAKLQEIFN